MKITSAIYETSSISFQGCPEPVMPEFALIGRSNVGKSSLLNLLTGKAELAKVSRTPGHTKMINFFVVNKSWRLVDLPGYGFAKVGKAHHDRFFENISEYLGSRESLRCVFVLIDSTLPPQRIDLEFVHWLMGVLVPFVLVFTKTDKVGATKVQTNIELFKEAMADFSDNLPLIFTSSAVRKTGHQDILGMVSQVLNKPNVGKPLIGIKDDDE